MFGSDESSSVDLAMMNSDSQKSVIIANNTDMEQGFNEELKPAKECKCCTTYLTKSGQSFGSFPLVMLPACLVFIPMIFTAIAYILAQVKGTLKLPPTRNIPYISDIGTEYPQSCFFTLGLAMSSFCTLAVVLVRYLQVKSYGEIVSPWVNRSSLAFGLLISFGKLVVASFQLTGLQEVHYFGAFVYAVSCVIYTPIQTFISHKDKTLGGKYRVYFLILRGFLTAGVFLGFLIFGIFLIPGLVKFNRPGYSVAQSGEWFFAMCQMGFMLTFIVDFWKLRPRFSLDKIE